MNDIETPREPFQTTVLLAEDDPALRALITETLERDGYIVREVTNGLELRERLTHAQRGLEVHDVVVADVRMPGCTGVEVLAWLRRRDWATPVVLITAFGDRALHAEASRLGAALVLNKPFDLDALRDAVVDIAPRVF